MNILFISGSFPYMKDGIGDNAEVLYKKFNIDNNCLLVTTYNKDIQGYCTKKIKNIEYIKKWNISINNYKIFTKLIKENNIDIVHIEYPGKGYGYNLLINTLPAYISIKHKHVKIVMRYHEFINSRFLRKIIDIPLLVFVDKIFIPSYKDFNFLRYVFKNKVIKTLIGTSVISENKNKKSINYNNNFTIGYFGFAYKGKGLEKVIDIFHEINKINSNIKLKLLCELNYDNKYHAMILKKIKDKNIEDNVIITGYLNNEETGIEIDSIDVALLPFDDGLTLRRSSMLTFISFGIPIVTSEGDKECLSIFDKNKDIFMSNDNKEIIDFIIELSKDREKLEERRKNIQNLSYIFDWNIIAKEMLEQYEKLITNLK